MNYDPFFETSNLMTDRPGFLRSSIPASAYRPVKKCPSCQSVYLTDTKCEACGRALNYHSIGEPFSSRSLYGFKERYYGDLPLIAKYFPIFENKESAQAKSYVRHLTKRLDALLFAFESTDSISPQNRRFFYVEVLEMMDELLRYGVEPIVIQQKIEASSDALGALLTQEFLLYLGGTKKENKISDRWQTIILNHRIMGLRVEFFLKTVLVAATFILVAVSYYEVISSQFGK